MSAAYRFVAGVAALFALTAIALLAAVETVVRGKEILNDIREGRG